MSELDQLRLSPRGGCRALMVGTVVLASAAAAVLALGAQDVRQLRLGLVAALWAALLGAFAVARMRCEISSGADRADQLRAVYQREVAAWREHTLTVELTMREQVTQAERREIEALRAELGALRANLEHLLGRDALVERVALGAEPARLVPLPTQSRKGDASRSRAAAAGSEARATRNLSIAGSSVVAGSSVRAQGISGLVSQDLPASQDRPEPFRFGPGRSPRGELGSHDLTGSNGVSNPQRNGRHSTPGWEPSGSNDNGGGARRAPEQAAAIETQRSVDDLLAAYGGGPVPRRRRHRNDS